MANGTSGRLDSIIQRDDRNAQNSFQQSESYLSRNLQERMQTKALRQNLLLGGINAAVNVGQLGLGVANYVQRGKQIDQQGNLQQQDIDQRGQQLAQQQENSQVAELLAGGAAASSIASNVMSMKRQKDQFDLSVTRGNERMLQNVSNDQDKIILERINANDPEALDEGLRREARDLSAARRIRVAIGKRSHRSDSSRRHLHTAGPTTRDLSLVRESSRPYAGRSSLTRASQ
jgi:hypothetical protein